MTEFYDRAETEAASGGSFMMGLLTGVAIGAGLGLLLAPKTGAELRSRLSARAGDLADTASDAYRRVADRAGDFASRGREAGREMFDKARDTAARTADQAERFARDAASGIPGTDTTSRG